MRLLKVKLEGIRRLENADALLVADRLVAIVGPNEAGKTSLLRALEQIDRIDDPIPAAMATRQCNVTPTIRALFELDAADREAIAHIPDSQDVSRCWVVRTTSGTKWRLERAPERDRVPRKSLSDVLASLEGDASVDRAWEDDEHPLSSEDWNAVDELSEFAGESMSDDQRLAVQRLADQIEVRTTV